MQALVDLERTKKDKTNSLVHTRSLHMTNPHKILNVTLSYNIPLKPQIISSSFLNDFEYNLPVLWYTGPVKRDLLLHIICRYLVAL